MRCTACGEEVASGAVFCQKCGERLDLQDVRPEMGEPAPDAALGTPEPQQSTASERFKAMLSPGKDDDDEPEAEQWKGGYSPKAMIGSWVGAGLVSVLLLVGGIMWWKAWVWVTVLVIILLIWLALGIRLAYRIMNVRYRLTDQRFVHETGILRRVTDRIEVIDIDDVTFEQKLMERFVGVGTIRITSSDRTHPELLLRGIDDVKRIANLIDSARRKERVRRGVHIEQI